MTIDEARAAKMRALEIFHRLGNVASVGITRVNNGYGLRSTCAPSARASRLPQPSKESQSVRWSWGPFAHGKLTRLNGVPRVLCERPLDQ